MQPRVDVQESLGISDHADVGVVAFLMDRLQEESLVGFTDRPAEETKSCQLAPTNQNQQYPIHACIG